MVILNDEHALCLTKLVTWFQRMIVDRVLCGRCRQPKRVMLIMTND